MNRAERKFWGNEKKAFAYTMAAMKAYRGGRTELSYIGPDVQPYELDMTTLYPDSLRRVKSSFWNSFFVRFVKLGLLGCLPKPWAKLSQLIVIAWESFTRSSEG